MQKPIISFGTLDSYSYPSLCQNDGLCETMTVVSMAPGSRVQSIFHGQRGNYLRFEVGYSGLCISLTLGTD